MKSSTTTRSAWSPDWCPAAGSAALLLSLFACGPTAPDTSGTDLEQWEKIGASRVYDRARTAPDGTRTADLLDLESGQGFWRETAGPIAAGETVVFSVTMSSRSSAEVTLQLLNYCTPDPPEVATTRHQIGREPGVYAVRHTFAHAQGCVRAQMILTSVDARIVAWQPSIERTGPTDSAPQGPTPARY